MNEKRETVRISIPFWGLSYCDKVLKITLPALLAPGNIPALAEDFDVEVSLVTEERLFDFVAQSRSVGLLKQYATVRFVALDDLLTGTPGDYGPVLSFALVRGYADLGEKMLDTWLMFVTADFILADGSYRTAARLMKAGHQVIHSPSFRAVSEEAMPALISRINPETGVLAVPPREMVDLALRHKHITVRARTVNQKLCHQWRMDQFYWYVDERTLIGYQWPIALVALKPERVVLEPKLMFDFGFIPDICPTAKKYYISDSDDFFIIEPQARMSGKDLVRIGWISQQKIAADLSRWTTAEHRECGQQMHIFHSADLPDDMDEIVKESQSYIADVVKLLGPAIPYDDHPLFREWWKGVTERIKQKSNRDESAPQSSHSKLTISGVLSLLRRFVYLPLLGGVANVRRTHPLWIDLINVNRAVQEARSKGKSIAWILPSESPFRSVAHGDESIVDLSSLKLEDVPLPLVMKDRIYDLVIVDMPIDSVGMLQQAYNRLRDAVFDGAMILVRISNGQGLYISESDLDFCEKSMPDRDLSDVEFYGTRVTTSILKIYQSVADLLFAFPRPRVILIGFIVIVLMPFSLISNSYAWRIRRLYHPRWSTMVLRFIVKKRRKPADEAVIESVT